MDTAESVSSDHNYLYDEWYPVCMGEVDRIDDLVVLGRAAPEPIDDGRHTVCLGGYSETVGYVRLYPTQKWMDELQRWNVVSVPVEDAHPDTRDESYKIAGSKAEWDTLHTKIEQVDQLTKTEQIQLVDELATDCANALRDEERSLGIVKPAAIHDFELDPRPDPTYQMTLDRERQVGKTQYPYRLYIEYTCEGCQAKGHHRQHCIEWGVSQVSPLNPARSNGPPSRSLSVRSRRSCM